MKSNYLFRLPIFTIVSIGMSFISSFGQQQIIPCGTDVMTRILMAQHPELEAKYEASETYTQNYVKNYEAQHKALARLAKKLGVGVSPADSTLFIVPIVFHILHENGPENISDAQIMDEMKVLNEDWGHTNPDTNDAVTAHFKSIEGNNRVQFRLARIDPNGNPTNGIDRIYTNLTVQANDLSKLNQWDRSKYLNVWVCKSISSGDGITNGTTLGYAYFPFEINNIPSIDGVLICNFCIGRIGTAANLSNFGVGPGTFTRCLSHEIGHVMNLEHPWGLTNAPGNTGPYQYANPPTSCGDDGVGDTPNTKGFFYCPTVGGNAQTSPAILADTIYAEICDTTSKSPVHVVTENFQNFMDYSECSMMFTQGQQERVWATLTSIEAQRNNLWDTVNLIATGVLDINTQPPSYPISIAPPVPEFYSNTCFVCQGNNVDFYDTAINTEPTSLLWTFNGASVSSSTQKNPVVQFDGLYGQTVSLTLSNSFGSNSETKYGYIYVSPPWTTYMGTFSEGFENSTEITNNWLFNNPFNYSTHWQYTNTAAYTGSGSLLLNSFQTVVYNYRYTPPLVLIPATGPNAYWDAITPSVDLKYASQMSLSFEYACASESNSFAGITETLEIDYSVDCGQSWGQMKILADTALITAGKWSTYFTPTSQSEWKYCNIPINIGLNGKPNVRFRFHYVSGAYSNNLYIDNVNLNATLGVESVSNENYHLVVYPNPMSNEASITYSLSSDQIINIGLYDITGRELKELAMGAQTAGQHTLNFSNENVSNGMYFVKLVSSSGTATQKLIVIK